MGIRQARLESVALSASGRESDMVNGRAAASGEKRIDLSEEIAWFGDILNIDGPLVEIGPRSVLSTRLSVTGSSQRGKVLGGRGQWHENSDQVDVGATLLSGVPESGCTLRLSARIRRPDGGKTA
jgi:hypothetical protein